MTEETYKTFEASCMSGRGTTWHSNNMTKDACIYIMCWSAIASGEINLSKAIAEDKAKGHIWTDAELARELDKIIAKECGQWKDKMPKIISVLNPANGEQFFPTCKAIYKRLQNNKSKTEGVQIGLDRAQIFSGALMTAECRLKLLEAHYGSDDERRKYYHPKGNSKPQIRQWLQLWSMWCFIDHVGTECIKYFATECYLGNDYGDFGGPLEEFVEVHVRLYKGYVNKKAMTFGGQLWNNDLLKTKGLKALWQKRTKRVVTQFFMHVEGLKASKFRHFWSAMSCWIDTESDYTMYPSSYDPPQGRQVTTWEHAILPVVHGICKLERLRQQSRKGSCACSEEWAATNSSLGSKVGPSRREVSPTFGGDSVCGPCV